MAEQSDGQLDINNIGDMYWEEVSRVRKLSDRDSSGESVVSVYKKSRLTTRKPREANEGVQVSQQAWKVIIVFKTEGGPDLHPIRITEAIKREIGKINHATFLGNGKLLIFANSEEQRDTILKKSTLNKIKITSHIPGAATRARGVITGIPVSVSMEEIKESLSRYAIVDAKRLTKGKERIDSMSILLSFSKELPQKVQMGYMFYPVREYIPPPLRCFKCQRFGHVASQCRGKMRCVKCGGEHQYGECVIDVLKCCNCGGPHSAAYGGCEKQKEAKEVQKLRVTRKTSYADAVKLVRNIKKIPNVPTTEQFVWNQPNSNFSLYKRTPLVDNRYHDRRPDPVPENCECKTKLTEDMLLVKKNDFIAFLCTVLNKSMQYNKKSDRIQSIVEIANDFLGSTVKANEIHEMLQLKYDQTQST